MAKIVHSCNVWLRACIYNASIIMETAEEELDQEIPGFDEDLLSISKLCPAYSRLAVKNALASSPFFASVINTRSLKTYSDLLVEEDWSGFQGKLDLK